MTVRIVSRRFAICHNLLFEAIIAPRERGATVIRKPAWDHLWAAALRAGRTLRRRPCFLK